MLRPPKLRLGTHLVEVPGHRVSEVMLLSERGDLEVIALVPRAVRQVPMFGIRHFSWLLVYEVDVAVEA